MSPIATLVPSRREACDPLFLIKIILKAAFCMPIFKQTGVDAPEIRRKENDFRLSRGCNLLPRDRQYQVLVLLLPPLGEGQSFWR